ncbi:MAG: CinA family protein [Candidatus Thioglobus sp.]|jgi:nicotinamide-nucleotide amidase|nr:CinA family protein [Candidatus Pseudothioglobus aerophilus]MBT3440386.1 CinA family protein [Gammaproteobacteria bacterium]MDP0595318.1 CinA family protein [Candidatus Thioglobus sp.]MBT4245143.1 CinA family protein [Gammaproteobacteria bacterium]MBT4587584.1 CinA family protein [Gammaproteobacteria bacterium]
MSYLKAKHLSELLVSKGFTISVAESCTGGSLSSSLTSISGASLYFNCGFITYSNQSKIDMLGVNPESIEMYGAVSEKVAHEMVAGAGQRSHSNLAISITGIAGPSGGSASKPVGMVCIGFFCDGSVTTTTQFFSGSRSDIVSQSVTFALVELSSKIS